MAYSYVFGKVIVPTEEFEEKLKNGDLEVYAAQLKSDPGASIEFRNGKVSASAQTADNRRDFEPIGIGRPLSLQILGYYTGDRPRAIGRNSMLVSSQVKVIDSETYDPGFTAVNQIVKQVQRRQYLQPSAEAEGTPIVFYTEALVPDETMINVKMTLDRFDEELFENISKLIGKAGSLPLFMVPGPGGAAASTALLAGAAGVGLIGRLGETLINSKVFLSDGLNLYFNSPDYIDTISQRFIAHDKEHEAEFKDYELTLVNGGSPQQYMVLMKNGQEYAGPAPYIALSLDGRRRDNLKGFKARAATSAILEQYVSSGDDGDKIVEILEQAMGLLNDATFRERALKTQAEMKGVDDAIAALKKKGVKPDAPEFVAQSERRQELEKRLNGFKGNIQDELFKLPSA